MNGTGLLTLVDLCVWHYSLHWVIELASLLNFRVCMTRKAPHFFMPRPVGPTVRVSRSEPSNRSQWARWRNCHPSSRVSLQWQTSLHDG